MNVKTFVDSARQALHDGRHGLIAVGIALVPLVVGTVVGVASEPARPATPVAQPCTTSFHAHKVSDV